MDSQLSPYPDFSTQDSKKSKGLSFNVGEDRLLISAWLNTRLDPIQENEQKYI